MPPSKKRLILAHNDTSSSLTQKGSYKDIDAILSEKGVQINSTAFTDTIDKNVLAANNAPGIINGVGNNRFDPNGVLTTEQAIVMAQRALEALANS